MKYYLPIFLILTLTLFSCESGIEKQRLEKELLVLTKTTAELEKNFEKLQQEKDKLFHSSAKERFSFLYSFEEDKPVALKYHEENFDSIEWQKKGDKYNVILKVHPKKKPFLYRFVIFLYDRHGLILGSHYEKPGMFKKTLAAGKVVEKKFDCKLAEQGVPEYFSIVYHNPVE